MSNKVIKPWLKPWSNFPWLNLAIRAIGATVTIAALMFGLLKLGVI